MAVTVAINSDADILQAFADIERVAQRGYADYKAHRDMRDIAADAIIIGEVVTAILDYTVRQPKGATA